MHHLPTIIARVKAGEPVTESEFTLFMDELTGRNRRMREARRTLIEAVLIVAFAGFIVWVIL